jgi:ion channel POLLUX/CASTOR
MVAPVEPAGKRVRPGCGRLTAPFDREGDDVGPHRTETTERDEAVSDDSRLRWRVVHRVRYRFDNLLARGTWAVLLWLGAVTFVVVLVSATLLTLVGVSFTSDEGSTLQEDFWQSLLRTIDPGTMAGDVGWGRRILALIVTVFGLLVAGTLIGILAAGVEDRIADMRRGRSVVMEEDHVVVLGPSRRSAAVVVELLRGGVESRGGVVVMDDDDPTVLRDAVRKLAPDGHGKFVVRSGDAASPADLALVRPDASRSIVVVGDDDSWCTRVVLALRAVLGADVHTPIVVEMSDAGRALTLATAIGPQVHALPTELAVARIAAFATSRPDLTHVVEEIIDPHGAQIQFVEGDLHQGRTFGELVRGSRRGRPLGIVDGAGTVELAPDFARPISAGDGIITLSGSPTHLDLGPASLVSTTSATIAVQRSEPPPQDLLVVGLTPFASLFLTGWAPLAAPGSTITVVTRPGEDEAIPPGMDLGGLPVTVLTEAVADVVASLADGTLSPTTVALMAGDDPAASDTATILHLMTIGRALPPGRRPQLVVELVDPQSYALLPPLLPDDHVISRSLAAQMLTQLVEEPLRRDVLLALYTPGGPSLRSLSPRELGVDRATAWSEVTACAAAAGVLALGWTSASGTVLDPPPGAVLDPDSGHAVVIVA